MRMYTLVHSHLSGVRAGMHSGYVILEHMYTHLECEDTTTWVREYRNVVAVQGGTSNDLKRLSRSLSRSPFVWDSFVDIEADNVITAVSVLLTEDQYEIVDKIRCGDSSYLHYFRDGAHGDERSILHTLANARRLLDA